MTARMTAAQRVVEAYQVVSMRGFLDRVRANKLNCELRGFKLLELIVSPEGETTIIRGMMRESFPVEQASLMPLELHGVPVRAHPKMPRKQMWFVYAGGK